MSDIGLTPGEFASETFEVASGGTIPAVIGAMGAGLGLLALTPFLAPASVPMSLLGMALARRSGNWPAFALGALGVVLACNALLQSGGFWVAFAAVTSALGPL